MHTEGEAILSQGVQGWTGQPMGIPRADYTKGMNDGGARVYTASEDMMTSACCLMRLDYLGRDVKVQHHKLTVVYAQVLRRSMQISHTEKRTIHVSQSGEKA